MVETLLLNFLFLLFPVLIFLIFFENRSHTHSYNKYALVLFTSISMVLCMAYPIKLDIGFIFDLHYIPFILTALFCGYRLALPLYLILNICLFFIGGEGLWPSFLFSTAVFSLVPLLSKMFVKLTSRKRIGFAAIISFLTVLFYIATLTSFFQTLTIDFWIIVFYALTTHVIISIVIMILIEQILTNIKTREAYLNSERLNDISELSASVAHEIRNPLTVTNGFLQLLSKSETLKESEKTYIEFSLQELKRAEKIVDDFLALAKPQSEYMVYSNLKEELEYVKSIIIPYANMHQVDIQFNFQNSLMRTYDKNQIQQCLINLYRNGIEAMKGRGGTLYIDVSEQRNQILIKIKDTGIGMTREEVSRLGRPHYSTKKEGTGLGMLMVYSTINKLKGRIQVESEQGKGTTFLITIPV